MIPPNPGEDGALEAQLRGSRDSESAGPAGRAAALGLAAQAHAGLKLPARPGRFGAEPRRGSRRRRPPGPGQAPASRGGAGLGSARPAPPPAAPHLRAVLQRLLDGQLVDARHRGRGRAAAGDAEAAKSRQQLTPARPLSQATLPSPPAQS